MTKLRVASTVGQNSTLTVREDVFGAPVNQQLVAQAVRVYLANQRQGSSKVKTRSEINRTKKKWFKQKGTGNARHGARTPSLFVGGGVAHGPTGAQNWNLKMSATMKKSALISVLSAQAEQIVVCDDLAQLDGKTSSASRLLVKMLPDAKHILIVLPKNMPMTLRSLRNLPNVFVTNANLLNSFEAAYADAIVCTRESIKMLEERLGKDAAEVKVKEVVKEKPVAKAEVKPEAKIVAKAKAPAKKAVAKAEKVEKVEKPAKAEPKTKAAKPKAKAAKK